MVYIVDESVKATHMGAMVLRITDYISVPTNDLAQMPLQWSHMRVNVSEMKGMTIVSSTAWASCQMRKIAGAHAPGTPGTFFPATACKRSRHASGHVRDARAVMHAGIANWRFPLKSAGGENVPGIPGACATHNFTYLVRGPCSGKQQSCAVLDHYEGHLLVSSGFHRKVQSCRNRFHVWYHHGHSIS